MSESLLDSQDRSVPAEVYEALAAGSPAGRAEVVLRLLAERGGRLCLPLLAGQGAVLTMIELGPEALQARRQAAGDDQAWWHAERQALNLREAKLPGAVLRKADLRGALLERANLRAADLAGARLQGAALGEVDLRDALLEEADLRGASLRFANLRGAILENADLRGADLWGADLEGCSLAKADLRGAILAEASARGADLTGADLRQARLGKANFQGACLRGADLQAAHLEGACLRDAVLREAHLQGAVLTTCDVAHAHLGGAWLEKTRMQQEQLGGAIGEELAGEYEEARKGYLALERNFEELGDTDAASWAYRKKRRMQKWDALQKARAARRAGGWRESAGLYVRFGIDQLVEWVCDYGESVPRVLCSLFAVYLGFMLLYAITGSVVRVVETPAGPVREPTRDPIDLAVFSLMAMTTSGTPAVTLQPRDVLVHLLTGAQALLGIALTGLLGFVMGNRIRR